MMKLRNLFEAEPNVNDFTDVKPGARVEIDNLTKLPELEKLNRKIKKYEDTMNATMFSKVPRGAREHFEKMKAETQSAIDKLYQKKSQQELESMEGDMPKGMKNFLDSISKDCSQILDIYKSNGGKFMFRGTKSNADAFKGKPFDDRKAKDSNQMLSDALNNAMEGAGIIARRDNSIFVTSSYGQASGYGSGTFIIFPVNGFSFSCSNKIKDFVFDAFKFREYFLNVGDVKTKKTELLNALKNLDKDTIDKYFPKIGYSSYFTDYVFENLSDFNTIKKMIDDGVLDPKFELLSDINNIITPESVVKNLGMFWDDISKAINIGHEIVIRSDYYAINTRHEALVNYYLNNFYKESEEDKAKREKEFNISQAVEFINGEYTSDIGFVTAKNSNTDTVSVYNTSKAKDIDNVSNTDIKKIVLPKSEKKDFVKGKDVIVLNHKNPEYLGKIGTIDYVYSYGIVSVRFAGNSTDIDFPIENLLLVDDIGAYILNKKSEQEPNKEPNNIKDAAKALVTKGKEKGYVTYAEINTALPPDKVESEQIEDFISMLSELGINVVENEPSNTDNYDDGFAYGDPVEIKGGKGEYAKYNGKVGTINKVGPNSISVDLGNFSKISVLPSMVFKHEEAPFSNADDDLIDLDFEDLMIPEIGDTVEVKTTMGVYAKYNGQKGKVVASNYNHGSTILTLKLANNDTLDIPEEYTKKVKEEPAAEPASEPKKTYSPSASKIQAFYKKATAAGSVTQAELDELLPPDVTKDETIDDVVSGLKTLGVKIDAAPITTKVDPNISMSPNFKPYKGAQVLTAKEKNAWEQIMIKSMNDGVVEPLLTKAFKTNNLDANEFYNLAKNLDFPYWVTGKYLGNAGVSVDMSVSKKYAGDRTEKPKKNSLQSIIGKALGMK